MNTAPTTGPAETRTCSIKVVAGDHALGYDGLAIDQTDEGPVLRVRVGMVMTEQHVAYLGALLSKIEI